MSNFGDRVRIKRTPETVSAEVADMVGDVHGFTTPSATGVSVIGDAPDDHAINVYFEGLSSDRWFRPDLLEFLDHNAGAEMVVGNLKAVRQSDGSWIETPVPSPTLLDRLRRWFKQ
ncbi:hypothetical protein [Polaromonas sp. YR568]|uniref:hypothetical protein n=1 Tax=Polaromonas sp. YR568 TaxID=1855301 RepID=UPI00398C0EF3